MLLGPGPDKWPDIFHLCGGDNQSPIDVPEYTEYDSSIAPFEFVGYENLGIDDVEIVNIGYSGMVETNPLTCHLTSYVIRMLRIREITLLRMVEYSKSYCKSCGFQGLKKTHRIEERLRVPNLYSARIYDFVRIGRILLQRFRRDIAFLC